jgi:putative DNA primase/helicase
VINKEIFQSRAYVLLDQISVLDKKGEIKKVACTSNTVRELLAALPACGPLVESGNMPCWLDSSKHPNPSEIVAFRNGLLHIESRKLTSHTPLFFSENCLPFPYDPEGLDPKHWLQFLDTLWGEDKESQELLQEWFGYCLLLDTRQQKILLLIGPKRSGKGTIGRILTKLLGQENVASPTMASLGTQFGLDPLKGKPLAIISDARLSGRSDQAIVTERLLSISGEDAQTIDRKYKDPVTLRLPTRFMILTNELPRLTDASGALASRFLLLQMVNSFHGREDHGLEARLLEELPEILNWALEGLDRLRERGRFVQPATGKEALSDLEELGSPMAAFIREKCILDPHATVGCDNLFSAWKKWCTENGREHPGTAQLFARDLRAVVPGITTNQRRSDTGRVRAFNGIRLR